MRQRRTKHAALTATKEGLRFESSYDPTLVAKLKAQVPYTARQYDRDARVWFVAPEYGQAVADICASTLGIRPDVPTMETAEVETKLVRLEYLGSTKDRGGNATAYGYADGDWTLIFPESVLHAWFCHTSDPTEATTLYNTLGVKHNTSLEEIKQAYRRAVHTHHPDTGGDAEQFRAIQNAWEVLRDEGRRARYDSGLLMAAALTADQRPAPQMRWRSPLRCGNLLLEGRQSMSKFLVSRILAWHDIVNDSGQTLATYWPRGAKMFAERWI